MPALVYSISPLDSALDPISTQLFQDIRGNFEYARREIEILRDAGVDGVGFRDLGPRGRPFSILCIQHVADAGVAQLAVVNAQALIGPGAPYGVRVFQHSVDQGVYGVLDVQPQRVRAVTSVAGSLVPGAQAELRTIWTLHA